MAQSARFATLTQQPIKVRRTQRKSHKAGHSMGMSHQERRGWAYTKRRNAESLDAFLD